MIPAVFGAFGRGERAGAITFPNPGYGEVQLVDLSRHTWPLRVPVSALQDRLRYISEYWKTKCGLWQNIDEDPLRSGWTRAQMLQALKESFGVTRIVPEAPAEIYKVLDPAFGSYPQVIVPTQQAALFEVLYGVNKQILYHYPPPIDVGVITSQPGNDGMHRIAKAKLIYYPAFMVTDPGNIAISDTLAQNLGVGQGNGIMLAAVDRSSI